MKKRIIFSFLLVLAAFSLLALGVYELIQLNPNKHRDQIIKKVESRLNLKLSLGLIFPIVYPGIGFQIKDVEVDLPDPARVRPELFKADSMKLIVDLNRLVREKRIYIKEVIINEPEFYVEVGPQEKQRFLNLVKPKSEEQKEKEAELEKTLSRRIFKKLLGLFPLNVTGEDLLDTNRVLISKASGIIYDRRDKPKKLRAPMALGNIELVITKGVEKNTFQFRVAADHPYDQKDLTPLRFEGKGKMLVSLRPFDLQADFEEAKWGQNPFSRIHLEIAGKEGKTEFRGIVAGKVDLEQGFMNLKWAPIKYNPKQDQLKIWGEAEYQTHFQPGENAWEKFFNIDSATLTNVRMVLYDPAGKPGRILEPILLGNAKIEAKNIQGSNPGWVRIEMPFPYQEPIRKLQPFPVVLEGKIRLARNFSIVEFNSEKASLGANPVDLLNCLFTHSPGKFSLQGNLTLKVNDLSDFRQLLLWQPIKLIPAARFMNFSGTGRIILDFRYPGPGQNRFWYQGTAKLHNLIFDPGAVVFPIEKFSGEITISPDQISLPASWLAISEMPIQSDFIYNRDTKDKRPRFKLTSNVNELDLARLFHPRARKAGTQMEIGQLLAPVTSIWRGEFVGNRVKYKKFVADQVKGKWKYKDRLVVFPNLTCKYQDGWFQDGGTWLDFRYARTSEFHFRGHFENFQFKKIMDELFGYDFFVDGKATGEGYLSGKFVDGKLQKNTLNGHFKLTIREGNLIGYNLGVRILQYMGFKVDQQKYGLAFDKAKTELIFKDGVIYFDDIELRSETLEAHCAGQVDLFNETLNLWVSVYPLEVLATLTKPIPLVGALINQAQESLFGSYAKASGPWHQVKPEAYLPLLEKVPKAPKAPEFPQKPPELTEKKSEGGGVEKE